MSDFRKGGNVVRRDSVTGKGNGDESTTEYSDLKSDLERWREILLPASRILKWEQPYYPWIICAVTSVSFGLVAVLQLSTLTSVSLFCILLGIVDFVAPFIGSYLMKSGEWTVNEEMQFNHICEDLCNLQNYFVDVWMGFRTLRKMNPTMFFIIAMMGLAVLAWAGQMVDNLLLTYLFVNFFLLLPGLMENKTTGDYIQKALSLLNRVRASTQKIKVP